MAVEVGCCSVVFLPLNRTRQGLVRGFWDEEGECDAGETTNKRWKRFGVRNTFEKKLKSRKTDNSFVPFVMFCRCCRRGAAGAEAPVVFVDMYMHVSKFR